MLLYRQPGAAGKLTDGEFGPERGESAFPRLHPKRPLPAVVSGPDGDFAVA